MSPSGHFPFPPVLGRLCGRLVSQAAAQQDSMRGRAPTRHRHTSSGQHSRSVGAGLVVGGPPTFPGQKKSSGVRVRKHSQQKFNNEPEAKQQDWQQNQASGAPPPQQQGGNQVAPAPNAPAPSLQQKGAGMMGVIAEGMMHGVGWAFGQRAVDALMGPRTMEVVHTDSSGGAPPDLSSSSAPSSPTFDGSQAPLSSTGSSGPADTNAYGPEGWQWGNDESSHGGGDDDGGGWFGGGDGDW